MSEVMEVEELPCVTEFFRSVWYGRNMTEKVDAAWREMQEGDVPEGWDGDPTDDIREAIENEWWSELVGNLDWFVKYGVLSVDDFMDWNGETILLMSLPQSADDKCWLSGLNGLLSTRDLIEDDVADWYADV